MPMHQALLLFGVAGLLFLVSSRRVSQLAADLRRPLFLLALPSIGLLLSAASALVGTVAHAGTGFVSRHGWPKPFYFIYIPEVGTPSIAWQPIYFLGNALAHAAVALVLWTAFRTFRR